MSSQVTKLYLEQDISTDLEMPKNTDEVGSEMSIIARELSVHETRVHSSTDLMNPN